MCQNAIPNHTTFSMIFTTAPENIPFGWNFVKLFEMTPHYVRAFFSIVVQYVEHMSAVLVTAPYPTTTTMDPQQSATKIVAKYSLMHWVIET